MPPDTLGLLLDVRNAAQYIVEDTAGASYDDFVHDRRMRQLVERNLTIIGEAINRLHRRHPEAATQITAIQRIVDMRNVVVHGYDIVDDSIVWQTIQESLPVLREQVETLISQIDQAP